MSLSARADATKVTSVLDRGATHSDQAAALATSPALQLIYETAPIGLAFLSPDCRYVLINQHMTEICGISIAGHVGRLVRETVPKVADQVERLVQTIIRSGEPIIGIEINGQRPDGSNTDRVWITYWHPLKSASGEVIGINVAAEEITDRKRADAELAASREQLRKLNETLAGRVAEQAEERDRIWNVSLDLLLVSDLTGKILNVNPAWTATLGWSSEDLVGSAIEGFIHPDDRERSRVEFGGLATGGAARHFENRIRCRDGSYCWLAWRAVPDRGFIYAVARDITTLKRANEQLHALHRQLAHASRQSTMGAMTASIAHEIRQPLAAMVMGANSALRWLDHADPDLDEARTALEHIVADGHRMNELISSIRAMFGRESPEPTPVDVNVLVAEVLALAQGELENHRVSLVSDMRDGLPQVMAERMQLQQVLLNLIMNAVEAMSAVTGRERQLTVSSGLDDERFVRITVEDTGSGIDPAYFDRIFDAFFTTKTNGMGMGLSICRSVVEAHGGKLWASPRAPLGTTFYLTLPSTLSSAGA